MPTTVLHIRDNATGDVRVMKYEGEWDNMTKRLFEQAHYACDCNRALFFARAADEPEPKRRPCGRTRYAINVFVDYTLVYTEFF